jgi:hypothetical protein
MNRENFDFYQHVHDILKERYRSSFIPYHEVYAYLGRRFSMKKWVVKELIKSMEGRGYLKMKKRGIMLVPQEGSKRESESF